MMVKYFDAIRRFFSIPGREVGTPEIKELFVAIKKEGIRELALECAQALGETLD